MTAISLHVDIVSAEQAIFSGRAQMVVARGALGDLGIAAGHAPLLTTLLPGPIRLILQSGEEEIVYLTGGVLEVQPDVVTVLADSAVHAQNLVEAEIIKAKELAEKQISENHSDFDYSLARAELARAAGMLRSLQELRKKVGRK
jgi:F-type H+-transporting ATPase subunit epsilon